MGEPLTRRVLLRRGLVAGGALAGAGLLRPHATALGIGKPARGGGVWLPGDLHTHSTYSHDVYGGPTDDNTGPDESYTFGLPVAGKFAEARARGLRFLAVTDHNDVRSVTELGAAAGDLVAIPAYEHSIHGHAQMLGATRLYDAGDQEADVIDAMAASLRDAGGVFQANHPAYRVGLGEDVHICSGAGGCDECGSIHWQYGFDVPVDTVEVWNPSVARSDLSEEYWECWLNRGERIAGTGGSDSHWLSLHAVAGPGQPTTWVRAREAGVAGVLEGLRAGRTTISGQPPALGGARLEIEAPDQATIGDTVKRGTKLVVTAPGLTVPAVVRIRANGEQILEREFNPGDKLDFAAPRENGWVRAILLARAALPDATTEIGSATPQRDGMPMLAMTSPIYVRGGPKPKPA